MGKYDATLKLLLQRWAGLTLGELTEAPIARWHNIELPKVTTQYADLLAETTDGWLWHLELQTANDPEMALRMVEYALRVYRLFRRFPRQVVLYVGLDALRMEDALVGADFTFRYRLMDIRDLDGERLLEADQVGDNILAVLTRLRNSNEAVQRILTKIASLDLPDREQALEQLIVLAGLRQLEETVEQEARKMPGLNDLLEHKVLGREFKRGRQEGREEGREEGLQQGELTVIRRLISERFGDIPTWADQRLASLSATELVDFSVRVLHAEKIEDLR
jgi:predicted transposase YdaD